MSCDITVIVKGEDSTYRKKYLHYEEDGTILLSRDSIVLNNYVEECKLNSSINTDLIDAVIVKTEMIW